MFESNTEKTCPSCGSSDVDRKSNKPDSPQELTECPCFFWKNEGFSALFSVAAQSKNVLQCRHAHSNPERLL